MERKCRRNIYQTQKILKKIVTCVFVISSVFGALTTAKATTFTNYYSQDDYRDTDIISYDGNNLRLTVHGDYTGMDAQRSGYFVLTSTTDFYGEGGNYNYGNQCVSDGYWGIKINQATKGSYWESNSVTGVQCYGETGSLWPYSVGGYPTNPSFSGTYWVYWYGYAKKTGQNDRLNHPTPIQITIGTPYLPPSEAVSDLTYSTATPYEANAFATISDNQHYAWMYNTHNLAWGMPSNPLNTLTVYYKNNGAASCEVTGNRIIAEYQGWISEETNAENFSVPAGQLISHTYTLSGSHAVGTLWYVLGGQATGKTGCEYTNILYGIDNMPAGHVGSSSCSYLYDNACFVDSGTLLHNPAFIVSSINSDTSAPPGPINNKKLIRVGVIPYDIAGVSHTDSVILNQPVCKINTTTSYDGHNLAYFQDLKACAQDYYNEVLPNQVDLRFTIIGDGQWYADTSGKSEDDYSGNNVTRLYSLVNGGIVASQTDTNDYDIIVLVHSGYSSQRHNDGQVIPSGGGNGTIGTYTIWSEDPERLNDPVGIVIAENDGFGPWVHELGHAIAKSLNINKKITPELYTSDTVKQWDVMAKGYENGNYSNPPQMSSYVKHFVNLLGNDTHRVSDYGTYSINALENLKIGDSIFRYNLTDDDTASAKDYYLLEVRDSDIGKWDESLPGKNMVMYLVGTDGHDDLANSLKRITLPVGGVLGLGDSYQDPNKNLFFNVIGSSGTGQSSSMSVSIDSLVNHLIDRSYGVVMSSYNMVLQQVLSLSSLLHIADPTNDLSQLSLDLHAYCPEGRHIGMNYETGEFENQIPGSIVSGGNGGAPEWIFIPTSVTGCRFFVSSERINEYFVTHPDVAVQLGSLDDSYDIFARYLDPETGIFTSEIQKDQAIQPGVMMKHEVSGTTEVAVTPGVVGTPEEPPTVPLFCPMLAQSVTYSVMSSTPACTFTNGSKTLQLKDSSCNPIAGARVNLRKANGAYLTYVVTDTNGLADLSGYTNPDASYFELDYHGATYSTASGTFSSGIGVKTHPYELSLKGSDCAPIAGARVNLRKANDAYVTYALTNADGKASFEVVPNASMKLESDYRGGTWISESREPDTTITLGTDKYSLVLKDNAGTAISNARINMRKQNNAYVTYAMTNESGVASFEVLPNVPMVFEVDYNGATYQTAASATHEETQISTIPFGMRVLDSSGTPVSGARINLRKSNDAYVTYALTNTDGTALFQVVPGAQMKLEVDYHGYTYLTSVLAADTTSLTSVSTNVLALELKDSAGGVLPGVRVNLRKANSSYVTYAITNESGIASFEVVPGAQMRLEADYHGGTYQTEVATVTNNTTLQVQTSPITVHLTAQGNPLVNKRTDLLKNNGAYVVYGTTNAAGDVFFEVLPNTLSKVRSVYNSTSWVSDAVGGGLTLSKDF